jgi:hypothetical protein
LVVADINDTAHKDQNIPGVNQTIQLLTFWKVCLYNNNSAAYM